MSQFDEIIQRLERAWPAWQVWRVHRACDGPIWCARLWADEHVVLNASSPEELSELIEREQEG